MESSFKGYRAERRTDERASKRPKSSTTESKRRKNTSASQLRELTASLVKIPSLIILFGISKKRQLGVVVKPQAFNLFDALRVVSNFALLPSAVQMPVIKLGIIARQNNLAFQGLQKDKKPLMVLLVVLMRVPHAVAPR